MIVVNAIVYKSEEDNGYIAECLEIPQRRVGKDKEEAKKDLLDCLEKSVNLARGDSTINILGRVSEKGEDIVSEDCRKIFRVILLSENPKPNMRYTGEPDSKGRLEVHFYEE